MFGLGKKDKKNKKEKESKKKKQAGPVPPAQDDPTKKLQAAALEAQKRVLALNKGRVPVGLVKEGQNPLARNTGLIGKTQPSESINDKPLPVLSRPAQLANATVLKQQSQNISQPAQANQAPTPKQPEQKLEVLEQPEHNVQQNTQVQNAAQTPTKVTQSQPPVQQEVPKTPAPVQRPAGTPVQPEQSQVATPPVQETNQAVSQVQETNPTTAPQPEVNEQVNSVQQNQSAPEQFEDDIDFGDLPPVAGTQVFRVFDPGLGRHVFVNEFGDPVDLLDYSTGFDPYSPIPDEEFIPEAPTVSSTRLLEPINQLKRPKNVKDVRENINILQRLGRSNDLNENLVYIVVVSIVSVLMYVFFIVV